MVPFTSVNINFEYVNEFVLNINGINCKKTRGFLYVFFNKVLKRLENDRSKPKKAFFRALYGDIFTKQSHGFYRIYGKIAKILFFLKKLLKNDFKCDIVYTS